jgi:antitoxin ParD1/3/4
MPFREHAMEKTKSVSLGDHFDAFVERQVEQGRYGSANDVIQAGLRLLEEREMKVDALRAALIEGEQSGLSTPFDLDEFLEEMRREHTTSR